MRIKMPAVRIAQGDSDTGQAQQDILICGVCEKTFELGDINRFIQHKVHACSNKENYSLDQNIQDDPDNNGCGGVPLAVVNTRRPSISAPIKKGFNSNPGSRLMCTSPLPLDDEVARCSTPKPRTPNISSSPTHIKDEMEIDHQENCIIDDELKLRRVKQELDSTHSSPDLLKKRPEFADAESNTTHSEPSYYICSTCKLRLHSAWRLLQHAQNSHGIKIYLDCSSASSSNGSSPTPATAAAATVAATSTTTNSTKHVANSSSSSACSGSSASSCSASNSSLPIPPITISSRLPLLPPTTSSIVDPHNRFGVGGILGLPPSHQFPSPLSMPPVTANTSSSLSVFSRTTSSHNENAFRMEQIVSEQFRLNQHHNLGLAAAAAAVAAASALPSHSPYSLERPPSSNSCRAMIQPPASLSLPIEPSLDFYSQRLRQLAGTTSPGVANTNSLSPRKLTSPFTSPGSSQPPLQRSLTSPRSLNNNNVSMSNNNLNPTSEARCDAESMSPGSKLHHEENASLDLSSTTKTDNRVSSEDKAMENMEEKDKECEICGKKFRFQSNLQIHIRTHTKEKIYKCSVCDHACSQSSKLKRHMKIHKKSGSTSHDELTINGEVSAISTTCSTHDQISNEGSDDERMEEEENVGDDEETEEEEEEEEEDEEDEDEEIELDEEGDEDDDGDVPEDLTTKSSSSTPPNGEEGKSIQSHPTPSQTPLDKTPSEKMSSSGSVVGEFMDKFGLSHIQHYSEAFQQALQESHNPHQRRKDDLLHPANLANNNNGHKLHSPILENGMKMKAVAALKLKEAMANHPPLDFMAGQGFFGPGMPLENLFEANKRMKLDMDNRHNPLLPRHMAAEEGMYPGLWLPTIAAAQQREMFGRNDVSLENIFKSRKSNSENRSSAAKNNAPMSMAAAMNLNLAGQHAKKESRRNDTCEYCGKVFKNCSNLTVHRRSHTGEKPYKCELCSYACAQSSKLTRHMKTHGRMGKDVYKCRFCEMPFSVPSTLEKHMRKCVVNQNIKNENGSMLPSMMMKCDDDSRNDGSSLMPSMMIKCDDDSSMSLPKDNT